MDFSRALIELKHGKAIARMGWNGRDMWLTYSPGNKALDASHFWAARNQRFANDNGGAAEVLPCITMKTADGKIQMGWLASQSDLLADDWFAFD